MKSKILSLLILVSTFSFAGEKEFPPIKATVYTTGVKITHSYTDAAFKGSKSIVIGPLAKRYDQSSLRVEAGSGYEIVSISPRVNYLAKITSQELESLEAQKKVVVEKIEDLGVESEILNQEKSVLMNNRKISGDQTGMTGEQLASALKVFRERYSVLEKGLLEIRRKSALLETERRNLDAQIRESKGLGESINEIVVEVVGNANKPLSLEVEYYSNDAFWSPLYDLRADSKSSEVHILTQAKIVQSTGLDFSKVELTLSTNNPQSDNSFSYIQPWRIMEYNYQPQSLREKETHNEVVNVRGSRRNANIQIMDDVSMSVYANALPSAITSNPIQVNYQIKGKVDVFSGKEKVLKVKEETIKAEMIYVAQPSVSNSAFLTARFESVDELKLLPGEAQVFYDKSYVGSLDINSLFGRNTIELSLGKAKDIFVKRTLVNNSSEKSSFGSKMIYTKHYECEIKNTGTVDVKVLIRDHVPLSASESVEVEYVLTPEVAVPDKTGIFSYNTTIKPKEKVEYKLELEVTVKNNKAINF